MISKLIKEQLEKVEVADLSTFSSDTNSYFIKQYQGIKIDEDNCYLIKLRPSAFNNVGVIVNWNNSSMPSSSYLKVDIAKKMTNNMIKVVGVEVNPATMQSLDTFWSGWLDTKDVEVIQKL